MSLRILVFFRRDEEIVLALYARLAADLEARVSELPEGDVATRFRALMLTKLHLVAPYKEVLASLLATLLDPRHELGALSQQTEIIRSRVMSAFSVVVLGASDARKTGTAEVVRTLYAIHLAIMLLWTQDAPESQATRTAVDLYVTCCRSPVVYGCQTSTDTGENLKPFPASSLSHHRPGTH